MGDSYLNDVVRNLDLTYAHELFKNQYWNYLQLLKNKAGFNFSMDNYNFKKDKNNVLCS